MHPKEDDSGTVALIAIAVLTTILVIASIVSVATTIIIIFARVQFLLIRFEYFRCSLRLACSQLDSG